MEGGKMDNRPVETEEEWDAVKGRFVYTAYCKTCDAYMEMQREIPPPPGCRIDRCPMCQNAVSSTLPDVPCAGPGRRSS